MTVAVVTKDELDALRAEVGELREQIAALSKSGGVEREFLTPDAAAKRFGLRREKVYRACATGHLRAERVERGNAPAKWRIKIDDARKWYERYCRGESNQ